MPNTAPSSEYSLGESAVVPGEALVFAIPILIISGVSVTERVEVLPSVTVTVLIVESKAIAVGEDSSRT